MGSGLFYVRESGEGVPRKVRPVTGVQRVFEGGLLPPLWKTSPPAWSASP